MSTSHLRRIVSVAAAAAVVTPLLTSTAAQAAPGDEHITYQVANGSTYIANVDGSNARLLSTGIIGRPAWSRDGSRIAYINNTGSGLHIANADMSRVVDIPNLSGRPLDVAWWPSGSDVLYTTPDYRIRFQGVDGLTNEGELPGLVRADGEQDSQPSVSLGGNVAFTRRTAAGVSTVRVWSRSTATTAQVASNAASAAFSPDGSRLAYVLGGSQVWVSNPDGTGAQQVTTEPQSALRPAWSADGSSLLFESGRALKKINVASRTVTTVVPDDGVNTVSNATWQSVGINFVDRVYGPNAIGTGVAASRYAYADRGNVNDPRGRQQANAVVLTRSDAYYDALAGSALAISKRAPLLITPTAALPAEVLNEIRRVLGNSGTIYVLGGADAVSNNISNQLAGLGYTIKRIAGTNMFDTNIRINREITTTPRTVIVATGLDFYDALAAGAVAGLDPNTVIVLSTGNTLPAVALNYLNEIDPVDPLVNIVGVGGWGATALQTHWENVTLWADYPFYRGFDLIGPSAIHTAVMVAQAFFYGPVTASVATSDSWFDALTGGAMAGAIGGPMLINWKDSLNSEVSNYLSTNASSLAVVQLLGSNNSLADSLIAPIGDSIGLPGTSLYGEFTSTSSSSSARSLAARPTSLLEPTLPTLGSKAASADSVPGVTPRVASQR
ncbi:cell wall-binding repeat-containing protein [Micromonospora sp. NBC_01796]|uniref:cell wall-binding repeat-containing protein n=1 Tax=Micromonospora sp. NBC_01796 TaxID=2975987 RepID=UPI002DD83730|nr:cell wall-binding repeat-containing protein [Micromonospora sp. NBC_01796]WSA88094.1 cell wall-binding repeat-containing protein [Micromonospora sp. NBC_01796]